MAPIVVLARRSQVKTTGSREGAELQLLPIILLDMWRKPGNDDIKCLIAHSSCGYMTLSMSQVTSYDSTCSTHCTCTYMWGSLQL